MCKFNISLDKLKHKLVLFIYAGSAESGPPLGTVLGNLGVNTVKFCKQFNEYTEKLPTYLKLRVTVYVFDNLSFDFSIQAPSTGHLISSVKIERTIGSSSKKLSYVTLEDMLKLSLFKFPEKSLKESFPIIWGTVKSSKLNILL